MEGLSRQEYPAMLERLPPAAAVSKFSDRVKRIGKVNTEIADWLGERRRIEDLYVQGLKKLVRKPLEIGGDLGVFETPWRKILGSTEDIAKSHALFADRIEKDVEQSLRTFASTNKDMSGIATIQGNLTSIARELEDAQDKSDKLARKGGKASSIKVDAASTRLATANSQWDAQAPFIFETLQALDERRLNHLRDALTQYETHEAEQLDRCQKSIESTLGAMLEIDTSIEIISWATSVTAGKQMIERKGRQQSTPGSSTTAATPPPPTPTPRSTHTDDRSEHSTKQESSGESKIRSRFGTMLGKRRQSVVSGFRAPSPSKGGFVAFGGRNTASRDGRPSLSPQHSSNNLRASPTLDNRLSSLAESPPATSPTLQTNGTKADPSLVSDSMHQGSTTANGTSAAAYVDVSDVLPPPGPPPSHIKSVPEPQTDAEGYTVPAARTDAISQAQLEAIDGEQPQFKLDIQKDPIPEQDSDAQAALSSVANTLRSSSMITPSRKAGTLRGRRDVRNTVYVPSANSLDVSHLDSIPPSPGIPAGRAAALAALTTGDHSAPSVSDTTSIRSGHSLTAHNTVKHMDMHGPGLNVSIVETISATLENGVFTSAKINGEIALTNNKTEDGIFTTTSEVIRINNYPNLEVIGPNRTFIHPSSTETPDEFTIDLAAISSKSSVAFTYRVHADETSMARQGPLLLKAAWKPQDDKLGLVLEYSLNPACGLESITVSNLVLVAVYQGTRGSACQTKPTGTHIKEKSLVYWRLGDMALDAKAHKIVARIIGQDGVAPEPGHIEARWEINGASASSGMGSGITVSRLEAEKGKEREPSQDDPFADETLPVSPGGSWVKLETNRKFVSGNYEAR